MAGWMTRGFALAAMLTIALPAGAADLRMALSSSPSAMDPQFHNLGANLNVSQNMFDTLVRMDADMRLQPALAASWRLIDDHTWEFHLRPGVTLHDGAKLTADDVIFSLDRPATLVKSPAGFAMYTRAITGKTAVDANTLRLTTNGPYPLLLSDLSTIYILERHAAEGLATEDFTARVETYPMASYAPQGAQGKFSFGLIGFGSQTGESSSILRAIIACADPNSGGGLYNWSFYCNHDVDAALGEALHTVDDAARLKLLQRAAHLAMTTEAIIPLHFQATTWAARQGIAIEPRTDERTFAASFRPAP